MKAIGLLLLVAISIFLLAACGGAAATEAPTATELPAGGTEFPSALTAMPDPSSLDEQLAQIDEALKQFKPANIAYNKPSKMRLNESVTIELLLSLGRSEEQLKKELSETGVPQSAGGVEATPKMKAVLSSPDEDAFSIRPLHDDPVQLVSGVETTKWSWYVTAQETGPKTLNVVIYRLLVIDDEEYWREVEKEDIPVNVTAISRLEALDWKWIAGILITLAAIPVFWRWYDQRNKKPERTERSRQKPGLDELPANSKTGSPGDEHLGHVFISYRRSDSADIAGRIYDRLVDEFGRNPIFKDVDSIPLGIDFKEYLDRRISECDAVLAIIGDHWVDASDATGKKRLEDPADFVRIEIESALERGIPVIPLLVGGAHMPDQENLPPSLRKLVHRNGIQIRPDPDFHHDMDRLISALEKYIQ